MASQTIDIIFSRFTIISIQSQTVRFLENLIKQICSTNNSQFQHDIHKNSPHPSSKLKDHEFDVIIPTTYFSAQNKLSNLVGSLLLSRDANNNIAHQFATFINGHRILDNNSLAPRMRHHCSWSGGHNSPIWSVHRNGDPCIAHINMCYVVANGTFDRRSSRWIH